MKFFCILMSMAMGITFTQTAAASSWYGTSVYNDDMMFYVDADTVERTKDAVTIWVKYVQIKQANTDGSWAIASRWKLSCQKKTLQAIASSTYDQQGKFVKSLGESGSSVVTPDSLGEAMLKLACEANFLKDKSSNNYWVIKSNDVFQATKNYREYLDSQIDSAPK